MHVANNQKRLDTNMKVIISVNPLFTDYDLLADRMDSIIGSRHDIEIVYEDVLSLGIQYALEKGYPFRICETYDPLEPAAETIRNILMARYADMLACFGDTGNALPDEMLKRNKAVIRC